MAATGAATLTTIAMTPVALSFIDGSKMGSQCKVAK